MYDAFSRVEILMGTRAVNRLGSAKIAVFGIGGAGSYVVEALARCGVGSLTLVDHKDIVQSDINRQLYAGQSTVGRKKVQTAKEHIRDIDENILVHTYETYYNEETAGMFDLQSFDYIVDAMDVSASKVLLIEQAGKYCVPLISCLATDNKINPARLEIADISRVSNDPLAKAIRAELRKKNIRKVKVLCSREKAYKERRIGKQKEKDRCRRKGAERMRLQAFAKINLGLDVLGKREDGYHEVRMIMQTIRMYDQLDMRKSVEPGIHLTTNKKYIPVDENNLVWRAAKLMMDTCGIMEGVSIHLHKVIPVAAGMAGGSSDAAATLVGMNRLFHCGLSKEKLMELGVQIGADVPYCVLRGTALAEGIGEKLTVLPPMPDCWILIGKPGISVSTKYVYTTLDLNTDTVHPDIDGMKKALEDGNLYGITERMGNVLQDVTIPAYPEVERIKEQMKTLGAVNAMMSGSGPTVFGIFDNEEKAQEACQKLRESGSCQQVFLTVPFNNYGGKTIDGE